MNTLIAPSYVEILGDDCILNLMGSPEDGIRATTLFCQVRWNDQSISRAYVKCFDQSLLPLCLSNEVTGYILARSVGVPVPTKAGLARLPSSILDGLPGENYSPYAFVVAEASGESLVASFKARDLKAYKPLHDLLLSWSGFANAIAFDDWVANPDRNLGNVLVVGPENIVLIDHSDMPVSPNWEAKDLDPSLDTSNKLIEIPFSGVLTADRARAFIDRIEPKVVEAAAKHDACYQSVNKEICQWWDRLLHGDDQRRESIEHFMSKRAITSPGRLKQRFKTLAA